jgi:glutathione S-transferase
VITLYDYPASPHCVRVRLALALGSLPYRKVAVDLDGDPKGHGCRKMTPFGTVPLLVDGAVRVPQSYAALQWLGDKIPALLPRAGARRARVLAWVAAAATELDPPVRDAYDVAYFTSKPNPAHIEAAVHEVASTFDRLERARAAEAKAKFVAGPKPTIADAAIFPSFWLAKDLTDDHPRVLAWSRWPLWSAWYAAMTARKDVAAVLADADA